MLKLLVYTNKAEELIDYGENMISDLELSDWRRRPGIKRVQPSVKRQKYSIYDF